MAGHIAMALCNKDLQSIRHHLSDLSILSEERYDGMTMIFQGVACVFWGSFCCNLLSFVDLFFGHTDIFFLGGTLPSHCKLE